MQMLRNDLYVPWFTQKEEGQWGFEIISGEFKGVVVQIENVAVSNEVKDDNLTCDYHVIFKPSILTEEDMQGELFKTQFSLIMNDIIKEAIETFEQEKLNDENRNNDTKEPDSQ